MITQQFEDKIVDEKITNMLTVNERKHFNAFISNGFSITRAGHSIFLTHAAVSSAMKKIKEILPKDFFILQNRSNKLRRWAEVTGINSKYLLCEKSLQAKATEAVDAMNLNTKFFTGQLESAQEIIMNQRIYIKELEKQLKIRSKH